MKNLYNTHTEKRVLRFFGFVRFFVMLTLLPFSLSAKAGSTGVTTDSTRIEKIVVKGFVFDENRVPLFGATVTEEGTTNVTLINKDGAYSIEVSHPEKARLVFSFLGMKAQTIDVHRRTTIDVVMQTSDTKIDDVVVTGYGNILKEAYTGSATVISAKDIAKRPGGSFENLLGGISPGLITAGSGQPGDMAEVRLRGFGSLSSDNQPLYVIDGVIFDQMNTSGHSGVASSPMATLNPADIASISILKDAASASLYGSQGANGVIVITTRQGVASDRIRYSFLAQAGVSHVSNSALPNLVNAEQYKELWTEGEMHKLIRNYNSANFKENLDRLYHNKMGFFLNGKNFYQWQKQARENFNTFYRIPKAEGGYLQYDYWGADADKLPLTDWFDAITRAALFQQYDFLLSGGSPNLKYYLSLGFLDQQGVILNSNLRRYSARFNLASDDRKKLINWGATINISATEQSGPITTGTSFNQPHYAALLLPAVVPAYLDDGSYNFGFPNNLLNGSHNPIASARRNLRERPQFLLFTSGWLRVNFAKWLNYRLDVAQYYITGRRTDYFDQEFGSGYSVNGELTEYDMRRRKITVKNMLNVDYTIKNRHRISGTFGVELINFKQSYNSVTAVNFMNNDKPVLSTGSEVSSWTGSGYDYAQFSIVARADYSYRSRYYLGGSYRQDRSSRFSPEARTGNFWSVSGAWRISNERWEWVKSMRKVINSMKFKVSYGYNGTLPSRYYNWRKLYNGSGRYNSEHAIYQTFRATPDLSWEKNQIFNVGMDLGIWENRVKISAEYYRRKSSDLLQEVPVSQTSGYSIMLMNTSAGIDNKGFEMDLDAQVVDRLFKWNLRFNLATLSAKYYGLEQDNIGTHIMRNGESVNAWYLYKFAGIDSNTGNVLYFAKDDAGRDIISSSDNPSYRRILGKGIPSVTGGMTTVFNFRGWELSGLFSYGWGHHVYDSRAASRTATDGQYINYDIDVRQLDRWTPDHIYASNRIRINGQTSAGSSSRFLYKGDYLKLKNLRLQYMFPTSTFRRIGLNGVTIYAQAENLWVWTALKGYDPDLQIDGYINSARYPSATTYTLGLNFNF